MFRVSWTERAWHEDQQVCQFPYIQSYLESSSFVSTVIWTILMSASSICTVIWIILNCGLKCVHSVKLSISAPLVPAFNQIILEWFNEWFPRLIDTRPFWRVLHLQVGVYPLSAHSHVVGDSGDIDLMGMKLMDLVVASYPFLMEQHRFFAPFALYGLHTRAEAAWPLLQKSPARVF